MERLETEQDKRNFNAGFIAIVLIIAIAIVIVIALIIIGFLIFSDSTNKQRSSFAVVQDIMSETREERQLQGFGEKAIALRLLNGQIEFLKEHIEYLEHEKHRAKTIAKLAESFLL